MSTWGKGPYRINDKVEVTELNVRLGTTGNLGDSAIRNVAVANGVASLDGNGKVPISQIPDALTQTLTYNGLWDAAANNPTLTTSVPTAGNFYIVTVAGTRFSINWEVGDWIISDGVEWERVPNPAPVVSVNDKTGEVVINKADVGLGNVDNVSAANLRARSTHTGTQAHTTISGLGTAATVNMGTGGADIRTNTQNNSHFVLQSGYNAFNPSGDYTNLRARATTNVDVGAPATSLSLTAGNGLTGGGNLTANRTFTLGTPSTIGSGSSNTVGASTHSHALNLNANDIPNLPASKITSGTINLGVLPVSDIQNGDILLNSSFEIGGSGSWNDFFPPTRQFMFASISGGAANSPFSGSNLSGAFYMPMSNSRGLQLASYGAGGDTTQQLSFRIRNGSTFYSWRTVLTDDDLDNKLVVNAGGSTMAFLDPSNSSDMIHFASQGGTRLTMYGDISQGFLGWNFRRHNNNSSFTDMFNVDQNGNMSCAGNLNVIGTSRTAGRLYKGTTAPTSSTRMNYDGYFYATRLYAVSSLKYKNVDFTDALENSLDRVVAIGMKGVKVGSYKGVNQSDKNRWLIAEEIAEVSPEVITYADDGTPDAVDYNQLIPDLYAACAVQQMEITQLKDEINQLKQLINLNN